jgi:D-inositol-3-phosphate glycosyltransferase
VGANETALVRMLMEGALASHDAIVSPSDAGRRAWECIVATLRARLRDIYGLDLDLPVQYEIIPFGVDASALAPSTRRQTARERFGLGTDELVFLYLGRFSTLSKCDLVPLLLAFSQLIDSSRSPNVRLCLVGDDAAEHITDALRHTAAELGIADRVWVRPDPLPDDRLGWFAAADVFVSPSDHLQETFGITLAEAMAAGLPVIASDWDGYRNVVTDGETGLLVATAMPHFDGNLRRLRCLTYPTHDVELLAQTTVVDVAQLASAMRTLAEQPELRLEMGRKGRSVAERRFDWRVVVARYEALWERLTDAARHAGDQPRGNALFDAPRYERVFEHYPTRMLQTHDLIELTALGARGEPRTLCDSRFPISDNLFVEHLFTRLRACLIDTGPRPLADVLAGLPGESVEMESALAHVARMMKYGWVRVTTTADRDTRRTAEPR